MRSSTLSERAGRWQAAHKSATSSTLLETSRTMAGCSRKCDRRLELAWGAPTQKQVIFHTTASNGGDIFLHSWGGPHPICTRLLKLWTCLGARRLVCLACYRRGILDDGREGTLHQKVWFGAGRSCVFTSGTRAWTHTQEEEEEEEERRTEEVRK